MPDYPLLQTLLRRRLDVIGNSELRENDPQLQLSQLQEVSEAIQSWHAENRSSIPSRLNHFLQQSSLSKAKSPGRLKDKAKDWPKTTLAFNPHKRKYEAWNDHGTTQENGTRPRRRKPQAWNGIAPAKDVFPSFKTKSKNKSREIPVKGPL